MEVKKAIVLMSSPQPDLPSEMESPISSLLVDISQQVQDTIQNMLKMSSEIAGSCVDIVEEIDKCKESAAAKSNILEEEKERFQKAAMDVLQMLRDSQYP
ncbi:hypothetical protein KSP40_PGU021238 [Platanthera guangdongensis]|uniref:Uncharacterized protein n=1 Tax=Platanthera guangdongensis TaxID=2320717 RepID=A0ABR2MEE9_9ASPA